MKRLGFVSLGVLLVIALFTYADWGSSTIDTYFNEKDASQTLTVMADKASMHTLVVGIFTEPQGYYFLQSSGTPAKGRFIRKDGSLHLKANDGKEWKLTIQPNSSLRDESGTSWQLKSHAESGMTLAKNRATCQEKLGKDCPY